MRQVVMRRIHRCRFQSGSTSFSWVSSGSSRAGSGLCRGAEACNVHPILFNLIRSSPVYLNVMASSSMTRCFSKYSAASGEAFRIDSMHERISCLTRLNVARSFGSAIIAFCLRSHIKRRPDLMRAVPSNLPHHRPIQEHRNPLPGSNPVFFRSPLQYQLAIQVFD